MSALSQIDVEQGLLFDDAVESPARSRGKAIIYLEKDWDRGEGNFRWRGRCSCHASRNFLEIDWDNNSFKCFLGEFTNLNNTYYAHPTYRIECYKDRKWVATIDVEMASVSDEDAGNEPTVKHLTKYRNFSSDINGVRVGRMVTWTYFGK